MAGLTALTVVTGGAALVAVGTVAAGVATYTYGSYEVNESITGNNAMRDAMGDEAYYTGMAVSTYLASGGISICNTYNYATSSSNNATARTVSNKSGSNSKNWSRGLTKTSELKTSDFNSLKNNGTVKVNSSGSDRPVTGLANSYYSTSKGEHVFVYDNNGKLIYDISESRVKGFKINTNPTTKQEYYQPYKLEGEVPAAIKNIFGWK